MDFYLITDDKQENVRHDFFYGFENKAAVFRKSINAGIIEESSKGNIIYLFNHKCGSAKDFLLYLFTVYEAGQIALYYGDVVVIKINGFFISYRFIGFNAVRCFGVLDYFIEQNSFVVKEREEYLKNIHAQNKVLDVISGNEISIGSIKLADTAICAIDKETYYAKGDKGSLIVTDYYVYELRKTGIEIINPRKKPFCDIRSALMFFKYNRVLGGNHRKKRLLLFDRNELYLLRDYNCLLEITL